MSKLVVKQVRETVENIQNLARQRDLNKDHWNLSTRDFFSDKILDGIRTENFKVYWAPLWPDSYTVVKYKYTPSTREVRKFPWLRKTTEKYQKYNTLELLETDDSGIWRELYGELMEVQNKLAKDREATVKSFA